MKRKRFAIFVEIGCDDSVKIQLGEELIWDAITQAVKTASNSYDYYLTNVSRTFEYMDDRTYDMEKKHMIPAERVRAYPIGVSNKMNRAERRTAKSNRKIPHRKAGSTA